MRKKVVKTLVFSCAMATVLGLAGCGSSGPIEDENVKVNQYKGLEVKTVEKAEVSDDDVQANIDTTLSGQTTYEKVDRAAKDTDQVNIDYVGKVDGKEFDGGSAEGYDLVLGSGTFIAANGDYKGFEEQIVGHKAGDKFDIEVKFPSTYSEELADKVATFSITLNEVDEANTPELTDDLVATLSSTSKTVEEYKEEIKKQLEEENEETYNSTLQQEVSQALLDNTTIVGDLDDEIQDYYDSQYSYYESYASMYGMEMEDFCESYAGMSLDDFKTQLEGTAEKAIKFQYACNLIADKANLKLSDDEFNEKATELAEQYGYTDSTESTAAESDTSAEADTSAESDTAAEEATTEAATSALDQFLEAYGEDEVRDYLTEQEVMDYLVENCKQTDNPTTVATEETTAAEEATTEAPAEATTEATK